MSPANTSSSVLWRSFPEEPTELTLQSSTSTEEDFDAIPAQTIEDVDEFQVDRCTLSASKGRQAPPKRIIICSDGTWQSSETTQKNIPSNVTRLARSIARTGSFKKDGKEETCQQVVFYNAGVGTGDGVSFAERIRQAAFGNGLVSDVIKAYHFVVMNYAPHDEILCFGFSRGAYTARAVAGLITDIGIIQPHELDDFPDLYTLYRKHRNNDSFTFRQSKAYRKWITGIRRKKGLGDLLSPGDEDDHWEQVPHNLPPEFTRVVQVVGVFDTVGALGVPGMNVPHWYNQVVGSVPGLGIDEVGFHNTALSRYIKHAFHALALDEQGRPFTPTLWHLPRGGEQCPRHRDHQRTKRALARDFRKLLSVHAAEEILSAAWEALIEREMADQLDDDVTELQQVWFPGSHINIGGGNPGILFGAPFDVEQLALISFTWMCDQISRLVQLDDERVEGIYGTSNPGTLSTLADREIESRKKLIEYSMQAQGLGLQTVVRAARWALDLAGIIKADSANNAWALGPLVDTTSLLMKLDFFGLAVSDRTPGQYNKRDFAGNGRGVTNEAIHPAAFYRKDHLAAYKPGALRNFERYPAIREGKGGKVEYLYEWRRKQWLLTPGLTIPEYMMKPTDYISRRLAERTTGGSTFVAQLVRDYEVRMY
ncbi:Uncharacterized protein C8035_v006535 [Colletotrichum spinosum]|uniref:T6SS Phospholipase effector Tle1-like catalytic domain-containing protein n=1 Tax=Colletotrichum spinosum TaxID=1347390 RepID=A0A4R8QQG3_9PEZI|nr:Uncharacterized protein C8035_v006535 [Colletotrichum spinosum]